MKKQFTSFDVAAVVRELNQRILDSRVSNIYQLNVKTLLLKLRKADEPVFWLALGAGRRFHLTSYTVEKPRVPPAFCMALRKHLRNCWLTRVEQSEFERIVVFTFKTKTGVMQLFLELFGDGNIILVDENNKISQALSYKRMRDRNILRGEPFHFPPPSGKNPAKVNREEMLKELHGFSDTEVVRALARFFSIGGFYAEETLLRADVNKKTPCNALSDSMVDAVFENLHKMLSQVSRGELEPCIVLDEAGAFADVTPFGLRRYAGFKHRFYSSFNEALDDFYTQVDAIERAFVATAGDVDGLRREAERLERIVAGQKKVLVEAEARAGREKRVGDVIYAHSVELQALLERFLAGKKNGKEWADIVSELLAEKKTGMSNVAFFESFDSKHLLVNVCVDDLRFGMSLRKSLYDSAARFYERGKRAKRKLKGAKEALEETHKKLTHIEARIEEAEDLGDAKPAKALEELSTRKIKRKEWFEKFRWFVSSDRFLVVAGKDAVSNEVLVKKYSEPNDVIFHADVVGSPFVVVKAEGKGLNHRVLREAGEFAAAFSRGWREGFGSVDVYWVKPDQLTKAGPSGEYVPRGGFVVRGRRNWLRGVPLGISIGVVRENGEIKFAGGPVGAVKAKTKAFAVVVPGDLSGSELFKQILRVLARKTRKDLSEKVLKASVEEIRKFVPYGKGRVLEE